MSSRTAKFVSAIFASFLASAPITISPHSGAAAAEECLSGPQDQAPPGKHWYYRVDRATQHHCWYVGQWKGKSTQTASRHTSSSPKPIATNAKTAIVPSVADARAELASSQDSVEQPAPVVTADAATVQDDQRATVQDGGTPPSPLTSRWPESSGVYSSVAPPPASSRVASHAQSQSDEAASPSPVLAPATLAAADSSSERNFVSIPTLLLALGSALLLASLAGSAILKLGHMQPHARSNARWYEHPTRESTNNSRAPWTSAVPRPRRADPPRASYRPPDPDSRVAELLAQLANQPAT